MTNLHATINNLTVNLAADLGPRGIRVNAVAPGPIWTPLQPATRAAEKIETFGADTPLGRAGQPGEVAPAYVFLASPADASYVSGTVIGVTGGGAVFWRSPEQHPDVPQSEGVTAGDNVGGSLLLG